MGDNRWPEQVLEWMQPGRRTGRPRGRWIKGTHDSMAKRVVEEEQWMDKEE
jgi:hypothetical protein